MSEEETQKGLKKREYDELRRDYLRNKGYKVVEIWECNWWETVKGDESVKIHVRNNFPFKLPLTQESLLTKIREDKLFGYVQCDLEVPDGLNTSSRTFHQSLKTLMLVEQILVIISGIMQLITIYSSNRNAC